MPSKLPETLVKTTADLWPEAYQVVAIEVGEGIDKFVALQTLLLSLPESSKHPKFVIQGHWVATPVTADETVMILLFGSPFVDSIFKSILSYKGEP